MKRLLALVMLSGCLDTGQAIYAVTPAPPQGIPAVKAFAPADGHAGSPPQDPVVVSFNGTVDASSVKGRIEQNGTDVGMLTILVNDRLAEFTPAGGFQPMTSYTFHLDAATVEGTNPLVPFSMTFTTGDTAATPTDLEIQVMFGGSCALSNCHQGASPTGLDLSVPVTPASLNHKPIGSDCGDFTCTSFPDAGLMCSGSCDATRTEWSVVAPGAPCESCLLWLVKIGSMPQSALPYSLTHLDPTQIDRIERWITAGK